MAKIFRVAKNVNPHFYPVWHSQKPYNVLKGGRNSFKSSVIVLWLVREMLNHIKRKEKVNVVVIRKVGNTIRHSVFLKIQWALNVFGVRNRFDTTVSPFTIKHRKTGSTFYFYGQDDFEKLKGNDINDLIAVWYEEAAEFNSFEEFDQTNATFMRQKHWNAPFVKFFWSYNPPRNPYNWINEWVETVRREPNYLVHESSYLDDRLGFVTEQMLDEINRIKANDYDYYRYLYLGEAVGLGTNVYNMALFNLIDEVPDDDPIIEIFASADTGHQISATSVGCYGVTRRNNVVRLGGYYYDPQGKVNKKAPSELSQDIHDYLKAKGYNISKYTIDSAEGGLRNQYQLDFGIAWHGVAKKKKTVMIDYTHDLLAQGRFFVLNNKENQTFLEQCRKYEWDVDSLKSDNPTVNKTEDHTVDEFQYFVTDNLRRLALKH
ncbi:PBSX family phage terminase large subunit [Aerococcaceae bacterium NML160702]|nr:PBSX family phage terminase large subunit [Aerococcaceae bacterium NML160702]